MTRHRRLFLSLCISQALCLALGLFVRAQLQRAIDEEAALMSVTEPVAMPAGVYDWEPWIASDFLSFLWLCGLQTGVCWLILQRSMTAANGPPRTTQEVSPQDPRPVALPPGLRVLR